jgi:uncharacterized protein
MHLNSESPWRRYALIADLISRFDQQGITLGKTALQKIVFIVQRVFGFDLDYAYTLYTYGPFSADVARDLDIVAGLGGADIAYDSSYGGYELRPGPATDELRRRGKEFLSSVKDVLDQIIRDYGRASAKELELRSTIVYLAEPSQENEVLANLVHQVKPQFSDYLIDAARKELEEKGYLSKARAAS